MNKVYLHKNQLLQKTDLAIYDLACFSNFQDSLKILERAINIALDIVVIVYEDDERSSYLEHLCASEQLIYVKLDKRSYDLEENVISSSNYHKFAKYYDLLQEDLDFSRWLAFIKPYLKKDSYIVEAACGSGEIARQLTNYRYFGYDLSNGMIEEARKKSNCDFEVANMLDFVASDVDLYLAFLDSVNYLVDLNELETFFGNVYKSLKPNGIFVFDVHQLKILADFNDYYYLNDYEEFSLSWKAKTIDRHLYHNIVIYDEQISHEVHHEYIFTPKELEETLLKTGFTILEKNVIYQHDLYVVRRNK